MATRKPSAQLPIGSPDWQEAKDREKAEADAATNRAKHREGERYAQEERRQIGVEIGILPPPPANNGHGGL